MARDLIEYARRQAAKLPKEKGKRRLCSVITDKRGRILSVAYNDYEKSSPHMLEAALEAGDPHKPYWHAECRALHKLAYGVRPHKITVVRVDSKDQLVLAKPCKICEQQIKKSGIQVVEYSI